VAFGTRRQRGSLARTRPSARGVAFGTPRVSVGSVASEPRASAWGVCFPNPARQRGSLARHPPVSARSGFPNPSVSAGSLARHPPVSARSGFPNPRVSVGSVLSAPARHRGSVLSEPRASAWGASLAPARQREECASEPARQRGSLARHPPAPRERAFGTRPSAWEPRSAPARQRGSAHLVSHRFTVNPLNGVKLLRVSLSHATIQRVAVLGSRHHGRPYSPPTSPTPGVSSYLLDIVIPIQPNRNAARSKESRATIKAAPAGFSRFGRRHDHARQFRGRSRQSRHVRLDHRSRHREFEVKRTLWKKSRPCANRIRSFPPTPAASRCVRISDGFSPAFRAISWARIFSIRRVPAPARSDPRRRYRSRRDRLRQRLRHAPPPAKASCRARTRPTSSPSHRQLLRATIGKITLEGEYSVEEVDTLTGPLIGYANSASFRLLDIVGLDVWSFVGENLYTPFPDDPCATASSCPRSTNK